MCYCTNFEIAQNIPSAVVFPEIAAGANHLLPPSIHPIHELRPPHPPPPSIPSASMEEDLESDFPCASIAVDSLIRVATAGVIWGLCSGPHDATKQGLTGRHHASFVVESMGKYGVQCGLLGGVFSFTRCGVQRLRGKSDWVNGCIAGAIAGAAVAIRTRSWKEVISVAALLSAVGAAADLSRTI